MQLWEQSILEEIKESGFIQCVCIEKISKQRGHMFPYLFWGINMTLGSI